MDKASSARLRRWNAATTSVSQFSSPLALIVSFIRQLARLKRPDDGPPPEYEGFRASGSLYVRGQPQDYDDWEALGAEGWGWKEIGECFRKLEDNSFVERIRFEGTRAVAIVCRQGSKRCEYRAGREIILSAGSIQSPQLLQLSGVGPADHLRGLGIDVVHDSPGVGQNMRDHWIAIVQYKLKAPIGLNRQFSGLRLLAHVLRYFLFGTGLMSTSSHEICGFIRTRPELERPDAQIVFAPFSLEVGPEAKFAFEPWHGIQIHGFQQRSESRGSIMIQSTDPTVQPAIKPNYLSTELDRRTIIDTVRYGRKLVQSSALQEFVAEETAPGAEVQTARLGGADCPRVDARERLTNT